MTGVQSRAFTTDTDGGVLTLTFDLPGEKVNTLGQGMIAQFDALLDEIEGDEAVKAVVEINDGQSVTAAELIALCKEKLGSVMAPKTIDFVSSLPRSTVGKVLKKDLREQYWHHLSGQG